MCVKLITKLAFDVLLQTLKLRDFHTRQHLIYMSEYKSANEINCKPEKVSLSACGERSNPPGSFFLSHFVDKRSRPEIEGNTRGGGVRGGGGCENRDSVFSPKYWIFSVQRLDWESAIKSFLTRSCRLSSRSASCQEQPPTRMRGPTDPLPVCERLAAERIYFSCSGTV